MHQLLQINSSFNFYMFFGGTNFGFTAGANDGGPGKFNADITSYDYDAPLDEAGDPTNKYFKIRDKIKEFVALPNVAPPVKQIKASYGFVVMKPFLNLLSQLARNELAKSPIRSDVPLTFEALNQYSGFVLYEAKIPTIRRDPCLLTVNKLRDRALVYANNSLIGILSRENQISSLPYSMSYGQNLQILVENQGRINYNIANDFKGILDVVRVNNELISNWTITGYPLENLDPIEKLFTQNGVNEQLSLNTVMNNGPVFYRAEFRIESEADINDTYLNTSGWGKVRNKLLSL